MTRQTETANSTSIQFAVEPVQNLLSSLLFLDLAEDVDGLSNWITITYSKLSPEQKHANRVIFDVLWEGLYLDQSWDSFPQYLTAYEKLDPQQFKADFWARFQWRYQLNPADETGELPPLEELMSDLDGFHEIIKNMRRFKEARITKEICAEGLKLLADPKAMKALVLEHLTSLWNVYLREEWEHSEPEIEALVEKYQEMDLSSTTPFAAVRQVLERDLRTHDWDERLNTCQRLIFVPSVHIGPYATLYANDKTVWLIFGAAKLRAASEPVPQVSRSLLRVRLAALADEVRFDILEMIAREGEVTAQDIMTAFDLTQPTASRHLVRLCATGLITERRRKRVKGYRINAEAVQETLNSAGELLIRDE